MVNAKTCAVLYNERKTYSKRNGERIYRMKHLITYRFESCPDYKVTSERCKVYVLSVFLV